MSVAACVGATWVGGGVAGSIEFLARSLPPNGPDDVLAQEVRSRLTSEPQRHAAHTREMPAQVTPDGSVAAVNGVSQAMYSSSP